ncbi:hypothetical protein ACFRMN_21985 [Streptomyces sp. NPDC056835]|uniref:hypothetical protein n=1 Tax=Streptomyces sp. NPDC056835 TaxID=3345956 RepID=UPI0036A7C3D5
MWPLDPPSHSAGDSWETCTSLSRDTENNGNLGTRLREAVGIARAAADALRAAAESRNLHNLDPADFKIENIADKTVTDIAYVSGMTKGPGRIIYDTLMAAPEDELCPLCRHSDVSQLDHVMPKADYPALCVAPQNLVPVCGICNHTKSNQTSREANKVLLHPYFEHTDTASWLHAEVTPGSGGRLRYFAAAPPHWDRVFADRVQYQFDFLGLGKRYSSKANQTLNGMRYLFTQHLSPTSSIDLRTHLEGLATSHLRDDLNNWTGVAYRAWAADDAFCEGSFVPPP